jgi:hypothetical protein
MKWNRIGMIDRIVSLSIGLDSMSCIDAETRLIENGAIPTKDAQLLSAYRAPLRSSLPF